MKSFKLLYLIGIIMIMLSMAAGSYRETISQQEAIIDSLNQEILLRDNLIKQSKDTTYGEETTITKNHR
jgi:hypothetical protein